MVCVVAQGSRYHSSMGTVRCLVTEHHVQQSGLASPARPSTEAEIPLASAILQEALRTAPVRQQTHNDGMSYHEVC